MHGAECVLSGGGRVLSGGGTRTRVWMGGACAGTQMLGTRTRSCGRRRRIQTWRPGIQLLVSKPQPYTLDPNPVTLTRNPDPITWTLITIP